MRKNKLIELLQALPGNPSILLWNGLAEDWVDIETQLVKGVLHKQTFDEFLDAVKREQRIRTRNIEYEPSGEKLAELRRSYAERAYKMEEDVVLAGSKRHDAYLIHAKYKGATAWGQQASLRY